MVLTHGNGPQVGLLARQAAAYTAVDAYPLDVLGAETEEMIGYLLKQELANLLPSRTITTLLSRVEVDPDDPAFAKPTKPIGPVYTQDQATRIAAEKNWALAPDNDSFRRVVASPEPLRIPGLHPIRWLLERGVLVIAAGGGIQVISSTDGHSLQGVEAVIDKDLCSSLLARKLKADCLIIATDVSAVLTDWGLPGQRALEKITPEALEKLAFPAGSMGPKVRAAAAFVRATGKRAVIGSLDQIEDMLSGQAGTQIRADVVAKNL